MWKKKKQNPAEIIFSFFAKIQGRTEENEKLDPKFETADLRNFFSLWLSPPLLRLTTKNKNITILSYILQEGLS